MAVPRLVDHTHPAFAELLEDLVVRDGAADHPGTRLTDSLHLRTRNSRLTRSSKVLTNRPKCQVIAVSLQSRLVDNDLRAPGVYVDYALAAYRHRIRMAAVRRSGWNGDTVSLIVSVGSVGMDIHMSKRGAPKELKYEWPVLALPLDAVPSVSQKDGRMVAQVRGWGSCSISLDGDDDRQLVVIPNHFDFPPIFRQVASALLGRNQRWGLPLTKSR